MMTHATAEWQVARLLADVIAPLMVLLIFLAPLLAQQEKEGPQQRRFRNARRFWERSALAVLLPEALAQLGKYFQVWPGHAGFPSGHETFTAAAAACLVLLFGQRWLLAALPAVLLMGWALVTAGYHSVSDVIGGAALGMAGAALLLRLTR